MRCPRRFSSSSEAAGKAPSTLAWKDTVNVRRKTQTRIAWLPDDRPGETLGKVGDWLQTGTRLVWVIDPERRTARIYRADGSQTSVTEAVELSGEEVLPGFACPLSSLL